MAKERVEYEVVGRDVGGSKAFKDVGDAAETAGDKVDEAGDQADKAAKEYRGLAADIERTQAEMKRLAAEINKTGNFDLTKDLRRQQRELRKLLNINNLLDGDDGGRSFGAALGKTISGGLEAAGKVAASHPYIAVGVAAGITLGAPLIGAAVSAAVGGAAIAGGILLASKDSRVQNAWGALADSAKGQLTGAADVFVDPLVNGARTFDRTLQRILPRISGDFDRLAPVADRLFSGAAGFVEEVMPGVDALSTMGVEVLGVVADELPRLGAAISQMSESIASAGSGGTAALSDFLTLVEYSIVTTGTLIGTLEKLYVVDRAAFSVLAATFTNNQTAWDNAVMSVAELKYGTEAVTPVADKAVQAYQRFAGSVGAVGQGAQLTAEQLKTLSGQIDAAALTTDTLAGQMTGKVFNSIMGLDQAVLGFAESQTRLSESIRQNGLELDIHTAKGQANREAILGSVTANMQQYQANIAAGMSAADATLAYEANTRALEDQMRKAGLTQAQIDGLIGKYRGVPGEVNTDIAMHGLTEAINGLADLIREINGMPTYKRITIDQVTIARRIDAGNPVGAGVRLNAEGGLQRGPGTGTSDDIITRVSNGEYIVRAAAVRAVGVDALDRLNQADRNPAALASIAGGGGGVSASPRGGGDLAYVLERAVDRAMTRALRGATLRIDDRTGRIVDLYSRAG